MRTIYTLDVEDFTDMGNGYRVTILEHGREIGDGVSGLLNEAINEALKEAGISANPCLICGESYPPNSLIVCNECAGGDK